MTPTEEFNLMTNTEKRTIKVQIPNGPLLTSPNSWDYSTNLKATRYKSSGKPTAEHSLLKIREIDLRPNSSKKIYEITVLRQPESELKDVPRKNKRRM